MPRRPPLRDDGKPKRPPALPPPRTLPPPRPPPRSATWRACAKDNGCKLPRLADALREYQDPKKVDKIEKLNSQLSETKEILCQAIDKVLQRGEKLDDLVEKSTKLSSQSKLFYKEARKANSWCPGCVVM